MEKFTVRLAKGAREERWVQELHTVFFPKTPYDGTVAWLVWQKGKDYPVGFCTARLSKVKDWGFLSRAGIAKEARGHNLQKRLIQVRLKWAKQLGLKGCITYVVNWNSPSLVNLLKSGFKIYDPESRRRGKWIAQKRDGYTYLFKRFKRSS